MSVSGATALFVSALARKLNWNYIRKSIKEANICINVYKYMKGYISGVEILRSIQQDISLPMLPASTRSNHYCGDGVINNVVVEIFADSAEDEMAREDHYTQRVEEILIAFHSMEPTHLQDYIDSIPHIGIVRQIKAQSESVMARA